MSVTAHLIVMPIVVPLVAGAAAAAFGHRSPATSRRIGMLGALAHLLVCALLLAQSLTGSPAVYSLGDWPAPFGIVIVADRLAATLLVLTSVLSLLALWHANASWSERGRAFQALWQIQVMGISGAFLTGDLFNLFVFFEVLLAASYALLLHGGGRARVGSTIHFMVVNLTASAVFLIAVSLLYSVTGTLNMAHLAQRIAQVRAEDVSLVAIAGMLLLGVFAVKTGLFPFHFWVPASYGSAAAPVVALVVAKVGAYCIVRVVPTLFGEAARSGSEAGAALAGLAGPWILAMALATLAVGAAGALAARTLRQLAAMLTLVSIGTLVLPLARSSQAEVAASLYYLIHSTVATAALFLVAEWLAAARGAIGDALSPGPAPRRPVLLAGALVWAAITAVGLPPSSGFVAKFLVLESLRSGPWSFALWGAVLVSSFAALIATSRALSVLLWNVRDEPDRGSAAPARDSSATSPAAAAVIGTCAIVVASAAIALGAGPLNRHTREIAAQMRDVDGYQAAVLGRGAVLVPWLRQHPERLAPAASGGAERTR